MSGGGQTKQQLGNDQQTEASQLAGQQAALNSATPTENYYEGSGGPQSTGLYKTLLTTGQEATSDAYQGAKTATQANENKAGYGYGSPASEGANTEMAGAEAHDLAQVPGKATLEAVQPQLQATGMQQSQAGYYNPAAYAGDAGQLAQAYDKQNQGLWGSLLSAGTEIGGDALEAAPWFA